MLLKFVGERVYERRAQMNSGKLGESEKVPMLQRLLEHKYTSTDQPMPDHDIISEMMGHMYAIYPCARFNIRLINPLPIQDRWFRHDIELALLFLLGA